MTYDPKYIEVLKARLGPYYLGRQEPEWQIVVDEAQRHPTVTCTDGVVRQRVRHSGSGPCTECSAKPGQLHVEHCYLDPCPVCGEAIDCYCHEGQPGQSCVRH